MFCRGATAPCQERHGAGLEQKMLQLPSPGAAAGERMASRKILVIDYDPRSVDKLREPLVAAGYSKEMAWFQSGPSGSVGVWL